MPVRQSSTGLRIKAQPDVPGRHQTRGSPSARPAEKGAAGVDRLRDADCKLMGSGTEGGTIQPMIINQCLTEKTAEREAFLATLMQ